jgi:hypothetical protein
MHQVSRSVLRGSHFRAPRTRDECAFEHGPLSRSHFRSSGLRPGVSGALCVFVLACLSGLVLGLWAS